MRIVIFPLWEPSFEGHRLTCWIYPYDFNLILVSAVLKVIDVFLAFLLAKIFLTFTGSRTNPEIEGVACIEDIDIINTKILLAEAWTLLHRHSTAGIAQLEESWLESWPDA